MPLQVDLAADSHTSSSYFIPSRLLAPRTGDKSVAGSGGVLHLQMLPAHEVSILLRAATHGAGHSSVCSMLLARLAFAASNAERDCDPLLPLPPASRIPPLPGVIPGVPPPVLPGWRAYNADAEWSRLCALGEATRSETARAEPPPPGGPPAVGGPPAAASGALPSDRLTAHALSGRSDGRHERKEPPPPISAWRRTLANSAFALCPTYPDTLTVPASADDALLGAASKFRSKGRVPSLTWLHPNGAALCRSSQPLPGLGDRRCEQDEKLLQVAAGDGT
jgi:hypothetical protein